MEAISLSLFTQYLSPLAFPFKTGVLDCAHSMPPVNAFLFGESHSLLLKSIHLQGQPCLAEGC